MMQWNENQNLQYISQPYIIKTKLKHQINPRLGRTVLAATPQCQGRQNMVNVTLSEVICFNFFFLHEVICVVFCENSFALLWDNMDHCLRILFSLVFPHIFGKFWNLISFATSQTNFPTAEDRGKLFPNFVFCQLSAVAVVFYFSEKSLFVVLTIYL